VAVLVPGSSSTQLLPFAMPADIDRGRARGGGRRRCRPATTSEYHGHRQQRHAHARRHGRLEPAQPADAHLHGGVHCQPRHHVTVTDYAGTSASIPIPVYTNATPLSYKVAGRGQLQRGQQLDGDSVNQTAPGGGSIATFGRATHGVGRWCGERDRRQRAHDATAAAALGHRRPPERWSTAAAR
jgi:hypothetical protein